VSRHKFRGRPRLNIPTTRISVLVINDKGEILLVRHRKGNRLYWVLPGGRLEYGETFTECGIRELKEETGLDIAIDGFLFLSEAIAPDRSRHIVNIYLKGHVTGGSIQIGDEPVLAGVEFIPLSQLEKLTLFPPIAKVILNLPDSALTDGIRYLGNLWV
jgi:8-oxo-dGTP diphosphatase